MKIPSLVYMKFRSISNFFVGVFLKHYPQTFVDRNANNLQSQGMQSQDKFIKFGEKLNCDENRKQHSPNR